MSTKWRLLDTGSLPAADNMALDEVILHCRSLNQIPNTIRFLQFSPHCALVGYHQSVELEVEEDYCRRHGIDINRRITGGGNLYWDEGQLGWEIYAGKDTPGIPHRLEDLYRLMCESTIAGLKKLGVNAKYRPKNDIEVNGRKISGTGGTEFGNAFLYQGSLLTDFDVDTMIACLKLPLKKLENIAVQSFKQRVICLDEVLGAMPTMKTIKAALLEGFQEKLGVAMEPGGLAPEEKARLDERLPFFQSDAWIYGNRKIQSNQLRVMDYKCTGGLIRVSARIDPERQLLKSIFITGDFFAYPGRSILDLEAALKNSSLRPESLRGTIENFFAAHQMRIPGVRPQDFYQAVSLAVQEECERHAAAL